MWRNVHVCRPRRRESAGHSRAELEDGAEAEAAVRAAALANASGVAEAGVLGAPFEYAFDQPLKALQACG